MVNSMASAFHGFYKGKKVLVTGHTGFKGAWLSLWLLELGAQVSGYSLEAPTHPSLYDQSKLKDHMPSHIGDIRDVARLHEVMQKEQPEIIFHLAAQPLVRLSYQYPVETFSTNVMGSANVLEEVRKLNSVRVCQMIITDKCYENNGTRHAYRETDPLGGDDPYSASKAAAEMVVKSYRHSFFPPATHLDHGVSLSSVRAGNVIGGGDWALDRLVPDCIRALSQNQAISIRNPGYIRPWQFVLDALSGYLLLAEKQWSGASLFADAWNFGPDESDRRTVAEVTQRIIEIWGQGNWGTPEGSKNAALKEASQLQLDCAKAKNLLNWKPVFNVDDALRPTVQWYREANQHASFDAFDYSLNQLRAYVTLAEERGCGWIREEQNVA